MFVIFCAEYKSVDRDFSSELKRIPQLGVPEERNARTEEKANPLQTGTRTLKTDCETLKQTNHTWELVECQVTTRSNSLGHFQRPSRGPRLRITGAMYHHQALYLPVLGRGKLTQRKGETTPQPRRKKKIFPNLNKSFSVKINRTRNCL